MRVRFSRHHSVTDSYTLSLQINNASTQVYKESESAIQLYYNGADFFFFFPYLTDNSSIHELNRSVSFVQTAKDSFL